MLGRMISSCTIAIALSLAGAGTVAAQAIKKPTGHKVTITGTVIDMSCKFGQGLTGAGHRECAQVCAGKGIPLAILTANGKLYVPTSPNMPGDGQNDRLKEFAEQQVTVTGTAYAAGGANAIWIDAIARQS